jgi:hypothetical protein
VVTPNAAPTERYGYGPEHCGQQYQGHPDHQNAEGHQRLAEQAGDVDFQGGLARDRDVDAILVVEVLLHAAKGRHQMKGRLVAGPTLRDDLDDHGVGVLVGRGQWDAGHARDAA